MKHELFVEQPNIELKEGIKVTEELELTYKNDKVEQVLKNNVLETTLEDEGTNGFNTYKSKSNVTITLNNGDILLFNEERGYYLPPYPLTTINDAISDISSLKDLPKFKET
jgi:hypothetical protein